MRRRRWKKRFVHFCCMTQVHVKIHIKALAPGDRETGTTGNLCCKPFVLPGADLRIQGSFLSDSRGRAKVEMAEMWRWSRWRWRTIHPCRFREEALYAYHVR